VNQFLAIARAEAGLPGAEREDVDLCALVNQLVETARGDERNARVRIAVDGCPARIRAVPERLETAIRNLLANACFYAEGQVDVALTVGPGEVALTVADDGPGIPEADLPRLFTRYHSSRPGGTGLGLAMAKAIVEAHGGSLEADAGRGATFRIRLPLA
jgi:signal transduction histidine kinase